MFSINVYSQNWQLIWSDEFNDQNINTNYWNFEIGNGNWGWGNNELQYYTSNSDNIFLADGYLNIVTRNENYNGYNYTSARIKTQDKFDFKYGKIEARIKMPLGKGLWPAFWMLGSNISTIGWPNCGEIDIVEHVNNEPYVHGTIHYDMWGHNYEGGNVLTNPSEFHLYALEWDEQQIKWYLDNEIYHTEYINNNTVSREEFHEPFFILLNLAIGGNWPGSPDNSTNFPAYYIIDYVRVYQKSNAISIISEDEKIIYPNPTTDILNLKSNNLIKTCSIEDLCGQTIFTKENLHEDNIQVNVLNLKSGTYLIKIKYDNEETSNSYFIKL